MKTLREWCIENNKEFIIKEWDSSLNGNETPDTVSYAKNKKVNWKCSLGHTWSEYISNRNRKNANHNCPFCSGHKVWQGFNDLKTKFPEIASEWNYEKNNELKPENVSMGSNKVVWWKCSLGHEWKSSINNRTRGNKCPICSKENRVSLPEKAIFFYMKKYFPTSCEQKRFNWLSKKDLDIYIPNIKVGIEYDGEFWHRNTNRDLKKEILCKNNQIDLIRIREPNCVEYNGNCKCFYTKPYKTDASHMQETIVELLNYIKSNYNLNFELDINIKRDLPHIYKTYITSIKDNSFASNHPELINEWNLEKNGIITPEMFARSSNKKVWWKCKNGHEWLTSISERVRGRNCPYCSNQKLLQGFNDLQTTYPQVAKEWNYKKNLKVTPKDVVAGTRTKVWWICKKGHEWEASIVDRTTNNLGCPICSNRKVMKGYNDLQSQYPTLMKQWDFSKNILKPDEISYHYDKKVWWVCDNGHRYECKVYDRVEKNTGCPYCANIKVYPGFNDLATKCPHLLQEWNYNKNKDIKPTEISSQSNKKVWWRCKLGHEWETAAHNRFKGKGCPYCSNTKVLVSFNDLKTKFPLIASDWNYEKNNDIPENYLYGSSKKVWWKCKEGHEWEATIRDRTYGKTGCPICYGNNRKKNKIKNTQS